jgi:hypothetical protein
MEPNDHGVGWKEVNLQLNGANEMLVERINKFNRDYSSLMVMHEKIQELPSSVKIVQVRKIDRGFQLKVSPSGIDSPQLILLHSLVMLRQGAGKIMAAIFLGYKIQAVRHYWRYRCDDGFNSGARDRAGW